ncbi:hypothetical protein M9458_005801, partial [Cirrhinus mrigala]
SWPLRSAHLWTVLEMMVAAGRRCVIDRASMPAAPVTQKGMPLFDYDDGFAGA